MSIVPRQSDPTLPPPFFPEEIPGTRVRFDGKATSWKARKTSGDGRYTLFTCAIFGKVYYTVVDWRRRIRGTINVIGGGMGIFTLDGEDPEIDRAIRMLEEENELGMPEWEISSRNQVPLVYEVIGYDWLFVEKEEQQ